MFAIKEIRKYYGPYIRAVVVMNGFEPLVFKTKEAAKKWLSMPKTYWLGYNQYGYGYQIISIAKPRNAAWLKKQCR